MEPSKGPASLVDESGEETTTETIQSDASKHVEMAYILLEDCQISVIDSIDDSDTPTATRQLPAIPWQNHCLQTWITVDQCFPSIPESFKQSTSKPANSTHSMEHHAHERCRRCNLVLEHQQPLSTNNSSVLALNWSAIPPFHGTIQDTFALDHSQSNDSSESSPLPYEQSTPSQHRTATPPTCTCHSLSPGQNTPRPRRSDAALIAGLLMACRAHVSVVQSRVLLHSDQHDSASLLFTLAFPALSPLLSDTRQCIIGAPNETNPGTKRATAAARGRGSGQMHKPLDTALQLLLSLIRCDWRRLEEVMARLPIDGPPHHVGSSGSHGPWHSKPSLFPSSLALGAVYERIHSSGSARVHRPTPCQRTERKSSLTLTDWPKELLVDNVAPFLEATSLAALRSTCRSMHWSLRGVVPGLRLRLYSHQCHSLSWMRQREASTLRSEADCLVLAPATDFAVDDGDVHRAVTGGTTVLLATRPVRNHVAWSLRVDAQTGYTIPREHRRNELALGRRVARGGLLCDDPGLGKTITVLALILQTFGLVDTDVAMGTNDEKSELQSKPPNMAAQISDSTEDLLFHAYWSERVTLDFRRPALCKLINDLYRRSLFQSRNSNDPLLMIKKAIDRDDYGTDFSLFERAVQ
jgi:SNF2-related domain